MPSLKNGFIQLATGDKDNDIIMALIEAGLSGTEYQLVLLIIRKTWGFKKSEDSISLSQFSKYTGKSRRQVIETIKTLVKKKILVKKNSPYKMATYSFNKDFKGWKILVKKTALVKKTPKSSEENRTLGSEENQHTTKETITKDTIQKKLMSVLDFENTWKTYPRKEKKKKAMEKFLKLDAILLPVILEAIKRQKNSRQWREGFIPHMISWLNDERWEDETTMSEKEYEDEFERLGYAAFCNVYGMDKAMELSTN